MASPSSRRAWIEIAECLEDEVDELVALLAEGVDRNLFDDAEVAEVLGSPSSRRAWIEIGVHRRRG